MPQLGATGRRRKGYSRTPPETSSTSTWHRAWPCSAPCPRSMRRPCACSPHPTFSRGWICRLPPWTRLGRRGAVCIESSLSCRPTPASSYSTEASITSSVRIQRKSSRRFAGLCRRPAIARRRERVVRTCVIAWVPPCGAGSHAMRYLVLSDVHANLEALEAVLADAPQYDGVLCLGDLVGYGPNPNECVERIN